MKSKRASRSGLARVVTICALIMAFIGSVATFSPPANASAGTKVPASVIPARVITSSSGSAGLPAGQSCPKSSQMAEHSGSVKVVNALDEWLFTTTLHVVWCYRDTINGTVTRILKINIIPSESDLAATGGWQFRGVVKGTSDGYYYNSSGHPNSGYHIFRDAHWRLCLLHVGCTVRTKDIEMNMNVFFNGRAVFYQGSDHL